VYCVKTQGIDFIRNQYHRVVRKYEYSPSKVTFTRVNYMYRRRFLRLLCEAAAVAPLVLSIRTAFASDHLAVNSDTLSSFLDVLIPKDVTPSASELEIHQKLLQHAYRIDNYIVLLQQGLEWLDIQSRKYFMNNYVSLKASEKEKITFLSSSGEAPSIVQLFFSRVKNDAIFIYYTQPESWKGMISSPPQPYGYLDFQEVGS
jgi:hypothetical protein